MITLHKGILVNLYSEVPFAGNRWLDFVRCVEDIELEPMYNGTINGRNTYIHRYSKPYPRYKNKEISSITWVEGNIL